MMKPRLVATGEGHSGAVPPKCFCFPPNFVVTRIIYFQHITNTKTSPPKNVFCSSKPENLATDLMKPVSYFINADGQTLDQVQRAFSGSLRKVKLLFLVRAEVDNKIFA